MVQKNGFLNFFVVDAYAFKLVQFRPIFQRDFPNHAVAHAACLGFHARDTMQH